MSKSVRVRTQVGKDQSLTFNLNQDFEFIEILSLKLSQNEIYTRQCADYGVVVGRISINNGFGIPNAKLSIFIPISAEDEVNPIINSIYPYKSPEEINEDGFRYNLLPYKPSYPGHSATGSFPDLEDVLTNSTAVEIYDKYYKFTVTTNDSGDFMLFGIPTGSQNLIMNVDLSDIGPFSQSPQDLIRIGLATESQVNGVKFQTSENLFSLPQIVSVTQQVTVNPLWGDEELCQISITRADIDLTQTKNIEIKPTAIFMGSIFSDSDRGSIKKKCKPPLKSGNLCSLNAGPGQILSLRQTIRQDSQGRPVLQEYELENNGNVIDENGTWLLDVPMNLDYITTNEFGEQVFSNDEKKGIPTRGKYRFKIKWNQSPDLSLPIRKANFLVPNVREHGWNSSSDDPFLITDPTNEDYLLFKASYAFSLNWDDYGLTGDTVGEKIIQEAINCNDKFYDMSYNKVYTISQLITRYTKGAFARRYSGIKAITDDECESTTNKFPSNDAQFKPDFLFTVFSILIIFLSVLLKIFVKVLHVVCKLLNDILEFLKKIDGNLINLSKAIAAIERLLEGLSGFNLPMYTYPDCELCDCKPAGAASGSVPTGLIGPQLSPFKNNSVLADLIDPSQYESQITSGSNDFTAIAQAFYAGFVTNNTSKSWTFKTPQIQLFNYEEPEGSTSPSFFWTTTLPLHERATLQTAKGKFFGSGLNKTFPNGSLCIDTNQESPLNQFTSGGQVYYLGGGTTQVKVCFNTQFNNITDAPDFVFNTSTNKYERNSLLNTVNTNNSLGFHYDNIFILLTEEKYESETLMTFENPLTYNDINLSGTVTNQFGTNSVTGTSINNGLVNIPVSHTHPMTGRRLITNYTISGDSSDNQFLRFPTGMEYYQVITSMTESQIATVQSDGWREEMQSASYILRVFSPWTRFVNMNVFDSGLNYNWTWESGWQKYSDKSAVYVTILMRGVDPHSTSQPMKIGLGRVFAKLNHWENSVEGNFKLNIPMQPNDGLDFGAPFDNTTQGYAQDFANRCVKHESITSNNPLSIDTGYSKGRLFFNSYHFRPNQNNWTSFTTKSPYNFITTSESDYATDMLTGFIPIQTDPFINRNSSSFTTLGTNSQGRGIRIRGGSNFHSWGADGLIGSSAQGYSSRSYQPGESVEGIPFMCLGGQSLYTSPSGFLDGIYRSRQLNSIYYSKKYSDSLSLNMSNNERIVMRSDRLPTSDLYQRYQENTMGGMANGHFKLYEIPIEGIVTSGESQPQQLTFQISEPETPEPGETPNVISDILATFSCQSLVPVNCYTPTSNGESIQVAPTSTCTYQSFTDRDGTAFNTQFFIEGSCYSLVRPPYNQKNNVKNDRELINEWASRININFGACREVFSHLFVNNWINGTLYMVPFRTTRFFTGPNDNPPNQPYNKYCSDTVFLHPDDFNFYYRSAPYRDTSTDGTFIGREGNTFLNQTVGNTKNHMYPTTIMDLGPRDELQKYLSQSGNWDGYIMNQLSPTSFGDTSELLNLFILSRLANTSFTNVFKARGASVLNFFDSRKKRFVDADFAQMIATNSQFGVDSYDPENYPEPPPNTNFSSSLYLRTNFSSPKDVVFGIFYNGNEQSRDYISPNRTVYDDTADIGDPCAIGSIPVTTQTVPFYLWQLNDNGSRSNIFGAQSNDWKFDTFSYGYQKIDRLIPYADSKIYQPSPNINQIKYHKGWIYNVEPIINPATEEFDYKPEPALPLVPYLFGAPYYFYFGLINGASAFDRFSAKWIDTENIV